MTKAINLALQGGGAHGAYTWGVLETLLDTPEIEIAAISGTSAGALNGAALKAGLARGGRAAALENLAWLWTQVGAIDDVHLMPWLDLMPLQAMRVAIEASPAYRAMDAASRVVSPYSWGPAYDNPLRRIVSRFHYADVCCDDGPRLYICATNVRTGKIRIFSGAEISADAILASACLPTLFQAVQIAEADGRCEAYWDGGYTGNPALFPLYDHDLPNDIVIVNINPLTREELPRTAMEIQNRINEISFNTSMLRELRAIHFVKRLIADGRVTSNTMKDVYVHMIADDALMRQLSVGTKLVPTPQVIHQMRMAGRTCARNFLDAHLDDINVNGTVDLVDMFR